MLGDDELGEGLIGDAQVILYLARNLGDERQQLKTLQVVHGFVEGWRQDDRWG